MSWVVIFCCPVLCSIIVVRCLKWKWVDDVLSPVLTMSFPNASHPRLQVDLHVDIQQPPVQHLRADDPDPRGSHPLHLRAGSLQQQRGVFDTDVTHSGKLQVETGRLQGVRLFLKMEPEHHTLPSVIRAHHSPATSCFVCLTSCLSSPARECFNCVTHVALICLNTLCSISYCSLFSLIKKRICVGLSLCRL